MKHDVVCCPKRDSSCSRVTATWNARWTGGLVQHRTQCGTEPGDKALDLPVSLRFKPHLQSRALRSDRKKERSRGEGLAGVNYTDRPVPSNLFPFLSPCVCGRLSSSAGCSTKSPRNRSTRLGMCSPAILLSRQRVNHEWTRPVVNVGAYCNELN